MTLLHLVFQDLNLYLQDKVYLAGNQITLADVFMYYGIHPILVSYHFSILSLVTTSHISQVKIIKLDFSFIIRTKISFLTSEHT